MPKGLPKIKLPSPEELSRRLEVITAEKESHHKRIKEAAKPLYELVQKEKFTIESVVSRSEQITYTHTPHIMDVRIGPGSGYRTANVGYTTFLEILVKPENDIPVRVLNFYGSSIVQVGQRIMAAIPRFKVEKLEKKITPFGPLRNESLDKYFLDREYNAKEEAIEIMIIGEDKKVVRVDMSVNYKKYLKKKN